MADKLTGFIFNCNGEEWVSMVDVSYADRQKIEAILRDYETDRDVESFPLVRDDMETAVAKLYECPEKVIDNVSDELLNRIISMALAERAKRQVAERLNFQLNNLFNEARERGIELYSALTGEVIDAFDVYLA